jgi:hypothetical protein
MTNISLSAKLGDDAKYVGDDSAAAIESLPETAWAAMVEAIGEYNGEGSVPGIDCAVAVTHETIADFEKSRTNSWTEKGRRTDHEFSGFKAVEYERFQLCRGGQRRHSIVIDLGDVRVSLF